MSFARKRVPLTIAAMSGTRKAEQFFARHVGPLLHAAGFRRDHRLYRRSHGKDGASCFEVRPLHGFSDPEAMVFTVEFGLEVPIDRPWLSEELRASLPKPSVMRCQLQLRVLPDDDSALARFTRLPGDEGAWAPASDVDRVA